MEMRWLRLRSFVLLLPGLLLFTTVTWAKPAQSIHYFDADFGDADWRLRVLFDDPTSVVQAVRLPAGGNPGSFRRVEHSLPAAAAPAPFTRVISLHQRRDARYDPLQRGPIQAICYEEDLRILEGAGTGQSTGLALWQSGRSYIALTGETGLPADWQHRGPDRLLASEFVEVLPGALFDVDEHPDFSATGEVITFGFVRANVATDAPLVQVGAIDNWEVEVNCAHDAYPGPVDTPSPTPTSTSTPSPSSAPSATATETATAIPSPSLSPTLPPNSGSECICPAVLQRVPMAIINDALANPERYRGWGMPLDPNKPPSPANPLRACLELQNTALHFHPIWNSPMWRVGCN